MTAEQVQRHARRVASARAARPRRASSRTCWSGPTRCSTASQDEADLDEIIREHSSAGRPVERLEVPGKTVGRKFFELYGDVAFFNRQSRVALRHNGVIDPESIEEYFHYRGFQALATVLERNDPQWVIDEITKSKLRGRGGGGYPTGQKWKMGARGRRSRRATSSATPTRAIPARSWTAACWKAIR